MKIYNYVILAASAAMMMSCGNKEKQVEPQVKYETKVLKAEDRVYSYEFPATLVGDKEIDIVPQVSGRIVSKRFEDGNLVHRGQVLFVIDQTPFLHEVQTAQASVNVAKAQAETARLEYESSQKLAQQRIVSDYIVKTNNNNYRTALATVQQAEAQLAIARTNLGYCTITSPITGVVSSTDINEGSMAAMGQTLACVSTNDKIDVKFSINGSVYLDIFGSGMKTTSNGIVNESGQQLRDLVPPVELKLTNGTTYPARGHLKTLSGILDSSTGAATCTATFPNPDGVLHSGLSATVVMPFTASGVLCVPQTATVKIQDQYMVYRVKKDGTVEGVIVEVIPSNDGSEFFITKGVNAGDEVVTNGVRKLTNGMRVK